MQGSKRSSRAAKKPCRQATLQDRAPSPTGPKLETEPPREQLVPHEMKLEPIVDKRSYDAFIRTIALRMYGEFEKALAGESIERPEVALAGLELSEEGTPEQIRMTDYIALNARLIVEKAIPDVPGYALRYMPRVARELEENGGRLEEHVEARVQRDLVMEIRAIAIQHLPEGERFSFRHKLKGL